MVPGHPAARRGMEVAESSWPVREKRHRAERKNLIRTTISERGEKLRCHRLNGFSVGCKQLRENEVRADTCRPENCCLRTPWAPTPIQLLSK